MPGIDFRELRRRTSIAEVLGLLRFETSKHQGAHLRGTCPIHEAAHKRKDDFSVNVATNCFRCFSCGKYGNQIDLWVLTQHLPLHSAAIDLCDRLGIEIPWRR